MLSQVMERVPSSSDDEKEEEEEEEEETLIHHNNNFPTDKSPKRRRRRSIFHIDDTTTNNNNNNNSNNKLSISKRYLFLIFLFLFILILYLSTDFKSLLQFSTTNTNTAASASAYDHTTNRMRESELQALYLLRHQQSALLNLWNTTTSTSTIFSSYNQTAPHHFHQLESALLAQISLNKQIQQLLLSTHQPGNVNNSTDPSFRAFSNTHACRKVDQKLNLRKTVQWKPAANKYLFAICLSGQMSNHLICLEKHMFFAALLDRILVIPSGKVDYQFNRVLDIDHINKCLGRNVVVTFEEFAQAKKTHLHIDKFICYFSKPQSCFLDDDHVKKLKSLGMTMNKLEDAWVEDVKKPSKKTMQQVVSKFSAKDQVIAIGDVFFADVEGEMVMQPGGPIAHKCKTLIEPSRLIMLTAQRFVQTFLGESFIALHFRRHGFLKFCNAKSPSCFFPIPQAAECISRLVEKANTPVIYLSTDAAESETNLLQSLIVLNGKTVPLVKRPARNSAEKWDALLYRHGLEGDLQVEAMLDKTISAMSSVFIGAPGSTFTEDILRLRKDWGSASLCDEYLCQGELPNFIADNE